jgi:hypothetical protein
MSKTLYEEAIADAKQLREIAEANAKNAIIESVTPRIRDFIEKQLLGKLNEETGDEDDLMPLGEEDDEDVALDETAVLELIRLAGGEDLNESLKDPSAAKKIFSAAKKASASLSDDQKRRLLNIASNVRKSADSISSKNIKENNMSKTRNLLFEVDLNDLSKEREAAEEKESMYEEDMLVAPKKGAKPPMKPGTRVNAKGKAAPAAAPEEMEGYDLDEMMMDDEVYALEGDMEDEMSEYGDMMYESARRRALRESKIVVDLGDVEIDPDAVISAMLSPEEEEEDEEFETGEDEEAAGDDDVYGDMGDMGMDDGGGEATPIKLPPTGAKKTKGEEDGKKLDEVFEIDENMLRRELTKIRGLNESKARNAASGMAHAFGGGNIVGEVDKVTMNKFATLKKEVEKKGRENHDLKAKLHEYRGAVETLREQLTDLNLFNAKLLYVNKLLQNRDLSASQRRSIIEALDAASSLREVKLLFTSLTESLDKSKSGKLSESFMRRAVGSSSRTATSAGAKSSESLEVDRWARLAGLNK